jgi:hypothetical protein
MTSDPFANDASYVTVPLDHRLCWPFTLSGELF